jgi:hypothetical protein
MPRVRATYILCRFGVTARGFARRFLWIAAIVIYVLPATPALAQHPEIWLTPFAPYAPAGDPRRGAPDYLDLFKPNAPWAFTASRVKVFKIYRDQVILMPDDVLKNIFRGLAERNIALAMETNILVETSVCGSGIDKAKPITPVLERLKRLGADLRYLALNEPLAGGHLSTGPNDCRASVQAVAADVAESLKPLWQIYPDLLVGDIEPIGRLPGDSRDWPAELAQWIEAYRVATGRPLAFMHADTVWGRSWVDDLRRLSGVVRATAMPFGVIYNGDFSELSDSAWADDTAYYAGQVEDAQGLRPDQVIFQSWDRWPQHSLPDSDPTTITGIVRAYLRERTRLSSNGFDRVQLTDETGSPIANAVLGIEERDSPSNEPLALQRIAGEVPAGVSSALLAMRVNTECQCPRRPAQFVISGFEYGEQNGKAGYETARFGSDLKQWASELPNATTAPFANKKPVISVSASAEQQLSLNGPHFPVHAGAQFEARFAWYVHSQSSESGYLAVIFLGPDGIEKRRTLHRILTTWNRVNTIYSDVAGFVTIPSRYQKSTSGGGFSVLFSGNSELRPTRLNIPN